jgi:PhzF family phenazine biosynthesis protein
VFEYVNQEAQQVAFLTKSGRLTVERQGDLLMMDFPARRPEPCPPPAHIDEIMGMPSSQTLQARDLLVVYENEGQVRRLKPDFEKVAALDCFGVIATAPGKKSDFVSRFFAPAAGIPEDPVTGSAHCTLIPYWAERLGKRDLHAFQLSERGGELFCLDRGARVSIGGRAVAYQSGTIRI